MRAQPRACTAACPRIFIYPRSAGVPPFEREHDWRFAKLLEHIEASPHHEPNIECAHYFVVHNYLRAGGRQSLSVVQLLEHLARRWPAWNATAALRPPRHVLLMPCDLGPGDCMFGREDQEAAAERTRHGLIPFELVRPSNPQRAVAFFTVNGNPSGWSSFRPGVDIRLPETDTAPCGPFCGLHALRAAVARDRRDQRLQQTVRRLSPWLDGAPISADRPLRLMWAGRGSKGGPRGDLLRFHQHRRDWLLHDTRNEDPQHSASRPPCVNVTGKMCTVYPLASAASRANLSSSDWMPTAMSRADFCYSPLGQNDGDSDRYLPAALYGCVPVFAAEGEALPLEEAVDWRDAALRVCRRLAPAARRTPAGAAAARPRGACGSRACAAAPGGLRAAPQIGAREIPRLPSILAAINATRLLQMRRALRAVWQHMLWPFFVRFDTSPLQAGAPPIQSPPRYQRLRRPPWLQARRERPAGWSRTNAFTTLLSVLRRRLGPGGCGASWRTHAEMGLLKGKRSRSP